MTLSAAPYKAPNDARKEYEKGIVAKKDGKLEDAQQHFEDAVKLYPKYTIAWYQLGTVLQKEKQKDDAHAAYVQATITDNKFLPPYLSLATLEAEGANWPEVLKLTGHVVALEPLKHEGLNGYILDLDSLDYAEVYFYEALANYNLHNLEAAEKSGVKAEQLDVRPRFPQLRLLLADIFAQKNKNAAAIKELQIFLELAPEAKNAERVRERIEELRKLNEPAG
jgi:tetratricopeptide (TPR) repeat protein